MNASIIFGKAKKKVLEEEMPAIEVEALWKTLQKFKPFLAIYVVTWLEEHKASPICLYYYIGYSEKTESYYFWNGSEKIYKSAKLFDDEPSKVMPILWDDVNEIIPEIISLLNELNTGSQAEKIKCPPGYFVFKYKFGIRTRETEGANQKGWVAIKALNVEEAKEEFKGHMEMEAGFFFESINVYQNDSFQRIEL